VARLELTDGQQRFARALARKSGLNSRVIAAWMLAEMGGRTSGAAQKREKAGNHNWLNIAYYDSGPGSITKDRVWRSPEKAAEATAQFLRGEKFGPSSGIRKIIKTAGSDPQRQIAAIGNSGWATNPDYGSNIRTLWGQAPAPGASSGPDRGRARVSQERGEEEASSSVGGGSAQLAALRRLFDDGNVLSFAQQMGQMRAESPEAPAVDPPSSSTRPPGDASLPGGTRPRGDLKELFYDPLGGWKNGQSIGAIGGHGSHVHVASGPRQLLALGKLAKDMGLSVRENPAFGDDVDPVHTPTSNHYRRFRVNGKTVGGALDISGDPKAMRRYALRVKRMYGVR
jgi:hypothetical protein